MVYTSKQQMIEQMKINLSNRKDIRAKALVRIFKNQTSSEQQTNSTNHYNGIGFTGADAPFLSSLAKQFISKNYLTDKQDAILAKKIKKYARQLVEGSIREGKIVEYQGRYYTSQADIDCIVARMTAEIKRG